MQRGTVKWFDTKRGYGFIIPAEGDGDVFFHCSVVGGTECTRDGEVVEFEAERHEKGLRATKVVRASAPVAARE